MAVPCTHIGAAMTTRPACTPPTAVDKTGRIVTGKTSVVPVFTSTTIEISIVVLVKTVVVLVCAQSAIDLRKRTAKKNEDGLPYALRR